MPVKFFNSEKSATPSMFPICPWLRDVIDSGSFGKT